VVADDLGYNDLGAMNGDKTMTPHLNALIDEGITMTDYYTFKICSPSRAVRLYALI
jgi:arylsulfatase A-like enzyme